MYYMWLYYKFENIKFNIGYTVKRLQCLVHNASIIVLL